MTIIAFILIIALKVSKELNHRKHQLNLIHQQELLSVFLIHHEVWSVELIQYCHLIILTFDWLFLYLLLFLIWIWISKFISFQFQNHPYLLYGLIG